jgi:hypothetical protein
MVGRVREALRFGLAGLMAVLFALSACADQPARSQIAITAQVAAIARIEGLSEPAVVTVSRDEAARGYVTAHATLKVRSNEVEGYVLTLWPRASWFESVEVRGSGSKASLSNDGGSFVRVPQGPGVDVLSLELTFRLRDGLPDGEYSWPIAFAVSPR